MSVVLFLLVLFVLILVHEWGHFITAKKTGMRVDEFGIGFPPRALAWKRGETIYSLNWLPIGGFVKILGENGTPDQPLSAEDRTRTFSAQPKWAQALVLIAGVAMNVIFAWLLFTIIYMVGVPTEVAPEQASAEANLYVVQTLPGSPAEALPVGAKIIGVEYGDQTLRELHTEAFSSFIQAADGEPVTIRYEHKDAISEVSLAATPGLLAEDEERRLLGVQTALIETQSRGFITAIVDGFVRTYQALIDVTVGLTTFLHQAITGTADFSQVAGPVGIVGLVGDAAAIGFITLLSFTAFISLNLAVINLLPIPALDGGRLLFVAIETITGRDIPPHWAGYLNAFGMVLLLFLMVAVTVNDFARLLG